jgi:predicted nucleotidyltransferase
MGYDITIKVSIVNVDFNTFNWKKFNKRLNKKKLNKIEWPMNETWHTTTGKCDYSENYALISKTFPKLHFKFYYYHFDGQYLTIYEYRKGKMVKKIPYTAENMCHMFGYIEYSFNPKFELINDISDMLEYKPDKIIFNLTNKNLSKSENPEQTEEDSESW